MTPRSSTTNPRDPNRFTVPAKHKKLPWFTEKDMAKYQREQFKIRPPHIVSRAIMEGLVRWEDNKKIDDRPGVVDPSGASFGKVTAVLYWAEDFYKTVTHKDFCLRVEVQIKKKGKGSSHKPNDIVIWSYTESRIRDMSDLMRIIEENTMPAYFSKIGKLSPIADTKERVDAANQIHIEQAEQEAIDRGG